MAASSKLLANRFGYGVPMACRSATILESLRAHDPLDDRFKRPDFSQRFSLFRDINQSKRDERDGVLGAEERHKELRREGQLWILQDAQIFMGRAILSDLGFRERLVAFWADHFTVSGASFRSTLANGAFAGEAIRGNITGSFGEMLRAAVLHPAMLLYLDQVTSFGPNSRIGVRDGTGLNENLAREILELHTMGVDGSYSQTDVREFANLLTGLQVDASGMKFAVAASEPGQVTILGKSYGSEKSRFKDILAFIDDLAVHPDTARHVATKLAVHFVSETPDADLVAALSDSFLRSNGDLMQVYETLLNHPASQRPARQKVRWPMEYMISVLRALDLGEVLLDTTTKEFRNKIVLPLQAMGQTPFQPAGPDGWSEMAEDWINPSTLTARIEWAVEIAEEFAQDIDPRTLLADVLGRDVGDALQIAVSGAETKWEGVALLLVSAEFNRR